MFYALLLIGLNAAVAEDCGDRSKIHPPARPHRPPARARTARTPMKIMPSRREQAFLVSHFVFSVLMSIR